MFPDQADINLDNDLDGVRRFFANSVAVKKQLIRLNAILEENLAAQAEQHRLTGLPLILFNKESPNKQNKLLSNYLYAWAVAKGFLKPISICALGFDEFAALLRLGYVFKDPGSGNVPHGEWSHLIQLWCLLEANEEIPFLSTSVPELLRRLGSAHELAWINTFEFVKGYYSHSNPGTNNFLSVTNFNHYILHGEGKQTVPLLSALLRGRETKRMNQSPEVSKAKQQEILATLQRLKIVM